jgi:branched-chain amino acid transport system substrate-binding protein
MRKLAVWLCASVFLAMVSLVTVAMAEQERAPLKVGVVLPLTGAYQKFGEIQKNAFLMGTEEINAGGGVNGRPIELLIEDDKSKIDFGRSAAEKLILRDKVVVLTGGYSSDVTFAMAAVAQNRKVPLLITSGAADEITEQSADYVFRLSQPVSEYERSLIKFLQQVVKPEGVVILYEKTLFGESGSRAFAKQAFELDWKTLLNEGCEAGTRDFRALLGKAKSANPDVVYMISNDEEEAALLVQQAKGLGFKPKVFVGAAAGFTLPEFCKLAGDAAENVYTLTLWTPQVPYPGAKEYHSNYMKKFASETD